MTAPLALGIDIGGTSIRAALVRDRTIVARETAPTDDSLAETVLRLARSLAEGQDVAGIGIGVPEYVHDGRVTSAEVIPWSDSVPAALERIAPVRIESDVRCGALAEWAESTGSLFYVSWGTGISSTLVLPDGRAWEGAQGRAIALGERRTAGGSLEAIASGRGIENAFAARSGRRASARELSTRDDADDLFERAGELLADALLDATALLDPARIVLGGGLGTAATAAREALDRRWSALGSPVALESAALGPDSGLVGAALVALR